MVAVVAASGAEDSAHQHASAERQEEHSAGTSQQLRCTRRNHVQQHLYNERCFQWLALTLSAWQVLWLLRTTKAFKALFPAEMEEQLATNVVYEK